MISVPDQLSFATAEFDTENEIKPDRNFLNDGRFLEAQARLFLAMNLDGVFLVEDHLDDFLVFKVFRLRLKLLGLRPEFVSGFLKLLGLGLKLFSGIFITVFAIFVRHWNSPVAILTSNC